MSTQFDDEKASIHQVEQVPTLGSAKPFDDIDRHLKVRIPASLINLSPEELAEVDRKATRKLDLLLLPVLVSLYILCVMPDGSDKRVLAHLDTLLGIISIVKISRRPRLLVSPRPFIFPRSTIRQSYPCSLPDMSVSRCLVTWWRAKSSTPACVSRVFIG